jgi:frataxin-like iron-binding protein CyaY
VLYLIGALGMWTQENSSDGKVLHKAISAANTQDSIKVAVLACADQAFSLFDDNVKDESMYCLFDWDFSQQVLTISITDPSKTRSAKHTVQLTLENYAAYLVDKEDQQEQMQLWLHNHLTTSAEFLQYSLVAAIIADGNASDSVLL